MTRKPDLEDFWIAQADWSRATFGSDQERGPMGPVKHLQKEVLETLHELENGDLFQAKLELVDCLFLVFDAARRAGYSVTTLTQAAFEKLDINKSMEWVKQDSNEPMEHKR